MSKLNAHGCPVIGSGTAEIVIVNANDRNWTRHRYVLCFGAYGWTKLLAYANSLDDALDECIDWIADHAPGLLCDDSVAEEYARAIAEGLSEDEAMDRAEQDTTSGGNCGNRIASHEWGILAENPGRTTLMRLAGMEAE